MMSNEKCYLCGFDKVIPDANNHVCTCGRSVGEEILPPEPENPTVARRLLEEMKEVFEVSQTIGVNDCNNRDRDRVMRVRELLYKYISHAESERANVEPKFLQFEIDMERLPDTSHPYKMTCCFGSDKLTVMENWYEDLEVAGEAADAIAASRGMEANVVEK